MDRVHPPVFIHRIVACGLLLAGFLLPMAAWAVDTDGDGVDDSVDAFPNNAEATVDTDGDGAPNAINNSLAPVVFSDPFNGTAFQSGWSGGTGSWSVSGGYAAYKGSNGNSMRIGRIFDVPGGGQLSFRHQRLNTYGSGYLRVDSATTNTLFTSASWVQTTVNLAAGSHMVDWTGACSGNSLCPLAASVQFDDVVLKASSLALDKFSNNPAASIDSDSDGFPDSWNASCDVICQANSGLLIDNCPVNANPDQLNTDGDAQGNLCDSDDDNDGVSDGADRFPLDPAESLDTDNDGIGNNADTDDDNDSVPDATDNCPLLSNPDQWDDDQNGVGNDCDSDGPGKLDVAFNPGTGANDYIWSMALQADGQVLKILISGMFTSVNGISRNRVARLNMDGSLDTGFNPGMGANGLVSVAPQRDGKVLVAGGVANGIARLNNDGTLDTIFASVVSGGVATLVLQADGNVLIGGDFTTVNGLSVNRIARLNSYGAIDISFNPGAGVNGVVHAVALQADGSILIGGNFTSVNGVASNRIARLTSNGSLDTGFDAGIGPNSYVSAITQQADGKVLIGGDFTTVNGVSHSHLARLNSDGSLDGSFNPGTNANGLVYALMQQADGKVLVGGSFTTMNGVSHSNLARLNDDGSLDTGFNRPGSYASTVVFSLVPQPDGKVLMGGQLTNYNGTTINRIARIHTGDVDNDGTENAADFDFDNDGVVNAQDAFPYDFAESVDTDHDGIGNNADLDDDGDSVPDYIDAAPLDSGNANERTLLLNDAYKGSAVTERMAPQ